MVSAFIEAVERAAGVPVVPAPARKREDTVLYKWYPGERCGASVTGRVELRFVARRYSDAMEMMRAVRSALLPGGAEQGRIEGECGTVYVASSDVGSGCGYISPAALFYTKCSFVISARSDMCRD
jgi:hypothetical protein